MNKRTIAKLPTVARPAGYVDKVGRRIKDAEAKTPGLRVKNLAAAAGAGSVTELFIYDYIDPWADEFWGGISAQMVIEALAAVDTDEIRVRINSPGGDVFDGIAIMNTLLSQNARVTVVVDALCASIATVIAMAGDTITMSPGSQMMIHPASGFCMGEATDMRQLADLLDLQTANIAGLYAARAGGDVADWLSAMAAETWMTDVECVTAGLADAVGVVKQGSATPAIPEPEPAPEMTDLWELSVFNFAGRAKAPAPRMLAGSQPVRCACHARGVASPEQLLALAHTGACPLVVIDWTKATPPIEPLTVMWDFVTHPRDSESGTCDECDILVIGNPYTKDEFPDLPVHPNCECTMEPHSASYGNVAPQSPAQPAPVFDPQGFVKSLKEAFA